MRKYEILMLLRPNLKDDVRSKVIEDAETLIGGKIVKKEEWGLKKLAYPIKKEVEAFYVLYYVETDSNNILEYRKAVNISKEIMRTLILVHNKTFPYNLKTTKSMKFSERKVKKEIKRRPEQKTEAKLETEKEEKASEKAEA